MEYINTLKPNKRKQLETKRNNTTN